MKILLICEASWTVLSFRKELIEYLNKEGHETFVIMGDNTHEGEVSKITKVKVIPYSNRSTNPFNLRILKAKFREYITQIKPDAVMTFFIKPNTIGVKAAYKAGVRKIYPMVEGLGDPFQPKNIKGRLVKMLCKKLYRSSFKKVNKVFFLNNDDSKYFLKRRLSKDWQNVVIPGIGISSKNFAPKPLTYSKNVLMMSRLIPNKGVYDFCKVARDVHITHPEISFTLLGKEVSITREDLKEYIDNGDIVYFSDVSDVRPFIEKADLLALPSYYKEGLPRSILEAMAMARPVIAYRNVGVNDCVFHDETGILVEPHNTSKFADKIIALLNDKERLERYSLTARNKVETVFESDLVNRKILEVISK